MRALAHILPCLLLCSVVAAQESKHEAPSADADELRACLRAGMGVGWRGIELPSEQGLQKLDSDYFPALDVGVQGAVALTPAFSLGFEARYQTSLGLQAQETPAGGVEKSTPLRSNDAQFGIVPGLRFADSPDAVKLGILLGWEVRGLRSVVELSTPSYTLHGPLVRAELVIPIARVLELRLAPEFTYILSVSEDLRELAAFRGGGTGVGGELTLAITATPWLGFELGYREAHVWAPTYWSQSFTDGGRYVTLRSVLEY
ncbi:MAG TPA: hypothetical protein VJV78_16990 [Polyangiales bacterium]|nr:hypothetical protein [Polyangiales bacterium]